MLQQEWHARVGVPENGFGRKEGRQSGKQPEAQLRSACDKMAADDGLDELISFLRNDRREVILNLVKVADGCLRSQTCHEYASKPLLLF